MTEAITLFDDLEWHKVTDLMDPEKQPLETELCDSVTVPARLTPYVFALVRRVAPRYDALNHLKKVRPVVPADSDVSGDPDRSDAPGRADAPVQILLTLQRHPHNWPVELAAEPNLAGCAVAPVSVPRHTARTDAQAQEWGAVWPVQVVHIREGARATVRSRGWPPRREAWARNMAESVWGQYLASGAAVCAVTDSFDADLHAATPPALLVTATDTRSTTGHALSHACMNAIAAVGRMDQMSTNSSREPFIEAAVVSPAITEPYYLSGLSVFLSHEPCVMCAMALVHSRVKTVYYVKATPHSGGLGSVYSVHEDASLNHKFKVWAWGRASGSGGDAESGAGEAEKSDDANEGSDGRGGDAVTVATAHEECTTVHADRVETLNIDSQPSLELDV